MEVAGTAVGIASLGIQVCQGLLSYYDSWKSYGSDISSTHDAITDLSKTLILLRTTLQQQADEERVRRVRTCVNNCEDALLELDKKRHSLQEYSQPEGLRQKMRSGLQRSWYPFRKETLEALKVSVTNVQERLKLALQVLQLDIGTESQKLVLRLLSQTATQSDSIAQIAAQNQCILDAQQTDEFRKIVAWLAPPDPGTNHASARQRHENLTGDWLLTSSQYQRWKASDIDHLWMYGKAGCGKTILSSTAIEDIRDTCEKDADISYAFFYFSFSDERKQSDGDLLRSLVVQLGWREPGLSMLLQAYKNTKSSVPGLDELEKILLASVRPCARVYLIMDALDECPEDHEARQRVLELIERLTQGASTLKILATSRELPAIRESMAALGSEPMRIATSDVNADIQRYVANQLSGDRSFGKFRKETLYLIESTIASKADGMFRWAYCQLQALKKLKSTSPKYVKQALDALPATLDDTYTRVLIDIDDMYHDHALTLLRWLAYARSPPTLSELVDAAVTDPIHESYIDIDNRGDLEDTLNILSGLVTVEEREDADAEDHSETKYSTSGVLIIDHDPADVASHSRNLTPDTRVRLAHFSVKEYLESKRILYSGADQFYLESTTGHRALAQSCLTYLRYYSLSCEKILTNQDLETFPLLEYAAQSWFYHSALQCGGEASREVSFLQIGRVRDDWLLVHDPDRPWKKPFEGREGERTGSGPTIYYASLLGLLAVVIELLDNEADVNAVSGDYGTALYAASAEGHKEIVQLLLDKGAKVDAVGRDYGTALQAASARGHKAIVQLLLEKGAKVDVEGGFYGTPLQAASAEGHKEIVQLLLDKGAEGGLHGTPLYAASAEGHKEIVQLLLDKGAKVDAVGGMYGTALQAASARGHKEIVQLLLEKGAKVDAVGGDYGTALQAPSAEGHKEIVQLLLDNGANVDAVGRDYGTALQAASARGHKEIVQLLLEKGAKVDVEGGFYGTPLQAASAEGHEGIVQLL